MLENKKKEQIKPGMFGMAVAADARRIEFDFSNEQLLCLEKKIDYLFLGDSITHLWNLHAYFGPHKFLENRGICGDTSTYLLKRFDADCIQLQPKSAIIMIGTNDITRTEPDLWWKNPGEEVETVFKEYQDNILQMVNKCDLAGIEVILCSVLPSTIAPPSDRERRWEMTEQMNDFLKSLGKTYVDYHSVLTRDGRNLPDEYSLDGIHPNAKAYVLMAEKLKDVLRM